MISIAHNICHMSDMLFLDCDCDNSLMRGITNHAKKITSGQPSSIFEKAEAVCKARFATSY